MSAKMSVLLSGVRQTTSQPARPTGIGPDTFQRRDASPDIRTIPKGILSGMSGLPDIRKINFVRNVRYFVRFHVRYSFDQHTTHDDWTSRPGAH